MTFRVTLNFSLMTFGKSQVSSTYGWLAASENINSYSMGSREGAASEAPVELPEELGVEEDGVEEFPPPFPQPAMDAAITAASKRRVVRLNCFFIYLRSFPDS